MNKKKHKQKCVVNYSAKIALSNTCMLQQKKQKH